MQNYGPPRLINKCYRDRVRAYQQNRLIKWLLVCCSLNLYLDLNKLYEKINTIDLN